MCFRMKEVIYVDLVTERCYIRKFCMNDVDDLYEVLSDEEVMLYIESAFEQKSLFMKLACAKCH